MRLKCFAFRVLGGIHIHMWEQCWIHGPFILGGYVEKGFAHGVQSPESQNTYRLYRACISINEYIHVLLTLMMTATFATPLSMLYHIPVSITIYVSNAGFL